jgi:metal-responsive CopG/Arc/MetJ family transcriptional regulator
MRERGKRTKESKSYSINKELCKELESYCDNNCTNASLLVERLIKEYLKKQNGKKR